MNHNITKRFLENEILDLVMYRDALILVLNKPSGLAVHNAGGSQHNLEQYFDWLRYGLKQKPHLAHRIDRGTSGCLLLARNTHAARVMLELFSSGAVKKTYIARVHGQIALDQGVIDVPLAKLSPEKKHWWMKADPDGPLKSLTEYRVLKRDGQKTLVELIPHTGRTHQLRVHCAYLGHPIIGDYIYGKNTEEDQKSPLHLHAKTLTVPLYKNKAPLVFEAPLPGHFIN